jgi:tRNA(Ile)-lysidine synthase
MERLSAQYHLRRLLVAVSGGPDSVCLLHLLDKCNQKSQNESELHIAHLNHQLRGQAADEDEAFVEQLTKKLGLPFHRMKLDITQRAQHQKKGIEETAREVRYAFFAELCQQFKLDAVVTGHTLDDQAETIVMHFVRGTGLSGLSGMQVYEQLPPYTKEGTKGIVVRPLLSFTREKIMEYLTTNNITYRLDHTNQDTNFTRNYIRYEIIPKLLTLNPNLHATLARNAELSSSTNAYFQQQIDHLLPQLQHQHAKNRITYDLGAYCVLPTALRWGIIRNAFAQLAPPQTELGLERVQAADEMLRGERGSKLIELGAGINVKRQKQSFQLTSDRPSVAKTRQGQDPAADHSKRAATTRQHHPR